MSPRNPTYPQLGDRDWLRSRLDRTNAEIAAEIGCSAGAVLAARKRLGLANAPLVRYPELRDREWLAGRTATATDREIAQELGCSAAYVGHARQALGIPALHYSRRRMLIDARTLESPSARVAWLAVYVERAAKIPSADEAAAALGVGKRTAYRYLSTIKAIYQETSR